MQKPGLKPANHARGGNGRPSPLPGTHANGLGAETMFRTLSGLGAETMFRTPYPARGLGTETTFRALVKGLRGSLRLER